ncbi:MAG: methyl-accepting chemotaxis protein [Haloplanus sp.]
MASITGDSSTALSGDGGWRQTCREFVHYIPDGHSIPEASWRSRHRNILILVLAQLPLLFGLGLYEGTESLITGATVPAIPLTTVLFELGLVAGLAVASLLPWFPRRVRTALATIGFLSTSIVLVHFSGGFIEAHFHFFVGMAVVAVYEDWVPFALGIGYVVLTHGVFGMINPERVYNHTAAINNPWVWGLIHGLFVLALAAALMAHWYSTERSREEAETQLRQAEAKTEEIADLEEKKAEIERAKAEAEEARAEAEKRQREVERLNDHLEAKADAYSAAMARAADGQLTVRLDADSESEAMARIGESFNEMMSETESTIREIQQFAESVAAASEEADTGAREAKGASEDVSEAIQEIADGANEQREMLETASTEMTDLSATVEEVAASAETVAERSHETAEIAEAGERTAQGAIEDARDVQTAIDSTVETVELLDERMAEIEEIIGLISDIAEQTNMLALNANIEAARAGGNGGTDGSGFAVVANEVESLAEETQGSANDIEELIEATQTQTGAAVEEARAAERDMQAGVEAFQEVVDAFTQVAGNAEATDSGIQDISGTADDQAASTEEVVSMVEDVADISRATASETESASAAAQQQAASMSQVSTNATSLSEGAEQLQALLATFEVGDSTGAVSGHPSP